MSGSDIQFVFDFLRNIIAIAKESPGKALAILAIALGLTLIFVYPLYRSLRTKSWFEPKD